MEEHAECLERLGSPTAPRCSASLLSINVTHIVTFMRPSIEILYDLAERQAGLFTTAQAAELGVSRRALSHHAAKGSLEHRRYGIYRLRRFPRQRFEDLVEAALWAGPGAAISYESSLVVYDVGDAMPHAIHVTVPRPFRGRRPGVILHRDQLTDSEKTVRDAVPVTTIERTLLDLAREGDPATASRAAEQAPGLGLTTRRRLESALRGHEKERAVLLWEAP